MNGDGARERERKSDCNCDGDKRIRNQKKRTAKKRNERRNGITDKCKQLRKAKKTIMRDLYLDTQFISSQNG